MPTTKPLLSTGGLLESRAYTPGEGYLLCNVTPVGSIGGGTQPFGGSKPKKVVCADATSVSAFTGIVMSWPKSSSPAAMMAKVLICFV
ncbi:MAG: hypothetical protein ACKVHL_08750 [Rhodospirillales bacterium]